MKNMKSELLQYKPKTIWLIDSSPYTIRLLVCISGSADIFNRPFYV